MATLTAEALRNLTPEQRAALQRAVETFQVKYRTPPTREAPKTNQAPPLMILGSVCP